MLVPVVLVLAVFTVILYEPCVGILFGAILLTDYQM